MDETIAQAHVEEFALSYFDIADRKDRNAQYDKWEGQPLFNHVLFYTNFYFCRGLAKLFFVCGNLFTVLEQFEELSQDVCTQTGFN